VTGDGINLIEGTVDNVEYGGRDSLLDVLTPAGVRLHVRAAGMHKPGEAVRMQVPVERVLVYPHD
jgi:putative spermidine/putrescine transport system ATP-binding protein